MDISAISKLANSNMGINSVSTASDNKTSTFDSIFKSAVDQINQTNNYSNAASQAETAYALGLTDNTSDLLVAQQKASLSLQYTVAIRNNVMDAYKEIMNLQF